MPGHILIAGLLIATGALASGAAPTSPKLSIGIFIDGLEYDVLVKLRDSFGKNGFNRFMEHGVVIPSVDYGTTLDPTASAAVIMTGASPNVNGISSSRGYDPEARRKTLTFTDPDAMGNFTDETYSPRTLLSSTLSDEIKIAGSGVGYVYSIATDPQQSIILAGHAADGALWLNEKTGAWAGSTFYSDMPTAVVSRNRTSPLSMRLDTASWTPEERPEAFSSLPEHLTHYSFKYLFPKGDTERYARFSGSPVAALEISELAGDIITTLNLGNHQGPDAINVAFNLTPYEFTRNADNRYELLDAYLKVDKAIAHLVTTAEKQAGKNNCLFYIISPPSQTSARRDDDRWRIPYGEFSVKKAISLLNMYLMALYGNGEWVTASDGDRFYLNHETVKSKELHIREVRREAASMLNRMSGIRQAFTIDDILEGRAGDKPEALKRNTPASSTYDVVVSLRPGWTLVDDFNNPIPKRTNAKALPTTMTRPEVTKVERLASTHAPAMILSPSLTPTTLPQPVDARMLAPTLARIMGIRAPNGSETPPLTLQ